MATIQLAPDFKDFLRLLNTHRVEYLLIGGYAVGYHGYPRATADLDIWVAVSPENAARLLAALREFGFAGQGLTVNDLLQERRVLRMGVPPLRIEVLTTISGVEFGQCYQQRIVDVIDGIEVNIIKSEDLKQNKRAAARHKDLGDLEHLP